MLIEWDPSLTVGDKQIDRDHQALVATINELCEAVVNNNGADIIERILLELTDYVEYHFNHEEQIMRRYHYPGTKEHVQQHADLIIGLSTLVYKLEAKTNSVSTDTVAFLKHWLIEHVKGSDMMLGEFLREVYP